MPFPAGIVNTCESGGPRAAAAGTGKAIMSAAIGWLKTCTVSYCLIGPH